MLRDFFNLPEIRFDLKYWYVIALIIIIGLILINHEYNIKEKEIDKRYDELEKKFK